MQCKLHIDLSGGVLDVEGDSALIREIYSDFKNRLNSTRSGLSRDKDDASVRPEINPKPRPRKRASAKRPTENGGDGVVADSPKLDKNLDTSRLGAFAGQFEPKTNPERILIFLKYMVDEIGVEKPNTDQVYTCFKKMGGKIPTAFAQAFYDTSSRNGFIDFRSPTDIEITIAGENHFNHDLKRKGGE